MKREDIDSIDSLRREGLGYKRIAAIMGLSQDTVKSYCKRHSLTEVGSEVRCKQCNALVEQTPHRKKKQFCSDKCRMAWWNAHPEMIKRKTAHTLVCLYCCKPFMSYGNTERKYCSRSCYASIRSKGGS